MLKLLYWPVACLLMAVGQGLLLPSLRSRVPPDGWEARQVNWSLHRVLVVTYFAPLLLAPHTWLMALLSRLLLFDLTLNLTTGYPLFDTGHTACFDRLLRRLAPSHPERLRLVVWVLGVGAACLLVIVNWK